MLLKQLKNYLIDLCLFNINSSLEAYLIGMLPIKGRELYSV